ncbi:MULTISPECIES: MBL fold metallo-hydrolase [unclassified Microcoleus]|uniref:MBL fold metallo-hydrolase n=1 Tax=unclassified Microcoleus TaxID=2642155 RepID=UPI001D6D0F2C|nr:MULTISPECIES: MBL fold metallo-hydrolase [unclassified Microcoleus]TAF97762.1 MAG: MBL fold metallo-hydrolase [Oscillatoriales cyanobacterium]MCC3475165.1 MBL fold metallo-hydrolase [Microcoleus sp. PH2017_13_LAR_U_A]MCC3487674.1 MBL fold metallo-hydrolase [Microcoleus sp. PH2017_14_LAR_D_A]MCC3524610.1 MBL fold metallo-hydrolase [Microcoleus sp. PH2017_20_SFW_D_A]MCC3556417.1 MBL fold metallo-hydrolase [Microcoleus sp. PH2017_35_SFW_U_B]
MAHINLRRLENISGNFYVDSSCIDCDTCRWMAPEVFTQAGEQSAVYQQPTNETASMRGLAALLSCPTSSIGTVEKPKNIKEVQQNLPALVTDNIYHCGYHSEKSYGAASYLIVRPEGNILVDSPRFVPPLVKNIEAMGGIRYLYLTHRDDVADHQKYREYFECDRILHTDEINADTRSVEIQLSGNEPHQIADDLLIISVPGHTKGHTVLLYNNKFLFSGDHLAWSENLQHLIGFRTACWYSWAEQIKSMQNLANYSFEWVLPGHGRRYDADRETMQQQMQKCIDWMVDA